MNDSYHSGDDEAALKVDIQNQSQHKISSSPEFGKTQANIGENKTFSINNDVEQIQDDGNNEESSLVGNFSEERKSMDDFNQ
mgnify:CR=1 FL=1